MRSGIGIHRTVQSGRSIYTTIAPTWVLSLHSFIGGLRIFSSIMTNPYIPPQGIYFRLLCVDRKLVLVSQTSQTPYVSNHPMENKNDDQIFELIPSTVEAGKGSYLIKAKDSQKFLYSRFKPPPQIGHNDDGDKAKNWFKLEFGTGRHASHFRLVSSTHAVVGFFSSSLEILPSRMQFDYQYFSFLFEDLKIVDVIYHLENAKPVPSDPFDIAEQEGDNRSSNAMIKITFQDIKKQSRSTTFEYTGGFNIAGGTSFKTGIPFIADSGLKVEGSTSKTYKWGETIANEDTYTFTFEVTVPAMTCVKAVARVTYTIFDVPYTVMLISPSKQTTTSHGLLKGIRKWIVSLETRNCP